ncbi:hypothetical protein INT48_000449 [Thamnidium elegans]|uniref:Uncharacterized protein n=1 Tax=Thamnidium elegans TaxID=101142 RepID=A0A8H7SLJ2_9FUNG|nr:hypothetical protein INT48_000449 [Thamnidium elegans]
MQNMDEPPIICTTGTIYESEENIVMRSKSNKLTTEQTTRDVSNLLTQRLEREAKRIRIGLSKLGLPNSSLNETNQNESAKGFSPSFPSSATSSHYFTPDMKVASSTSHMNTNLFYQQPKDWELEKTSILRPSQDYRKYIEELNIKHEKDKQSLLRKLQLQEQRIEEIEGNYANQTQEFQSKIQNAEKYHKIKEQEWKQQYEATLQTEQEKYDRRLNGFHQRMHAKDQEFAKLEESILRETKSAPSSPVSSTFPQSFPQHNRRRFRNQPSPPVISKEQYDHDISMLQQEIKQLRTDHKQQLTHFESQKSTEISQITSTLQNQHTAQLKQVADALQSEHTCKNQELLLLIHALESEKKSYVEKLSHFDALKGQMDLDRTKEFELHQTMLQDLKQEVESLKQTNQTKLLQLTEKFQKSESRLKSLFMNENQQLTMQCQAKVENLIAEHQNNLQELSDTLENENQVVRIKHQTAFEELNRVFTNQKLDWDQKLSLLNKQNQKITLEYTNFKKETRLKTKELTNLQQELKTAKRIANDVLSVLVDSDHQKFDPNIPLPDLLRKALSNISSLKTRTSIMESMESPYLMSSYGY